MLQTVFLIMFSIDLTQKGFEVNAFEFPEHEIYSSVPIYECIGYVNKDLLSNIKEIKYRCKTEKLYSLITGQETIDITKTGIYRT